MKFTFVPLSDAAKRTQERGARSYQTGIIEGQLRPIRRQTAPTTPTKTTRREKK